MPRIKAVSIDGAKFVIAPLTIVQMRDFIANTPKMPGDDDKQLFMGGPAFDKVYETICSSLNNAKTDVGSYLNGAEWTPDRCIAEMDQGTIDFLQPLIYEFTGLKTSAEASKKPGETPAASTA